MTPILTPPEAAELLRISVKTLRKLDLPRIFIGPRTVRYRRSDLETYLENQANGSRPPEA